MNSNLFLLVFVVLSPSDTVDIIETQRFETKAQCEAAEHAVRVRVRNNVSRIESECVQIQ